MKHIHVRTAVAVTLTCALFAASPASADDLHVVIRLYDMATSDAARRAIAMRTAAEAITSAGITVRWRDCSRGGAAHPCRSVRGDGDLVVRIMPAATGVASGDDVALGFAPIDPAGHATVIATVYYDMVHRVARRTGVDTDSLLGRAIAHEVGHLLLRVPGHGHSGLMRPLWTDEDLIQNRPDDWTFSEADRRQMLAVARESERSTESHSDSSGASLDVEAVGR